MRVSKNLTGDDLWEEILLSVEKSKSDIEKISIELKKGVVTFKNDLFNQEAIVHPSSKKVNVFQFTYFDKHGAVGDFEASSIEQLAEKIHEYGFESCEKKDFRHSILAENEDLLNRRNTIKNKNFER